jgi:flagellar protein FlaJ
MKLKRITFVPFPLEKAFRIAKRFTRIGDRIVKHSSINMYLKQAEIDIAAREYAAVAFFTSVFWFFIMFFTFTMLGILFALEFLYISVLIAVVISLIAFIYVLLYPKLLVTKKVKVLEKNLLYGLRHLTIQVKSGVSLFDSLVSVSKQDYGVLSKEFAICTKKISTGLPEDRALEELALKNPSLHFRRAIWQITNSMKSGTDLGNTLESIVNNVASEQRIAIRKYGSQLNPMAMMYMMLAVVIPSLGITFLIIISSFSGFPVTKTIFFLLLMVLVVFQFAFIGIIKNRRPSIEV